MSYVEQAHLGGYVKGGDDATFYPDLWKWLVKDHGVRTVLDIGCGEGHSLKAFRELGCEVVGTDGIAQEDPDIHVVDYTKGPPEDLWAYGAVPATEFDLGWCCEVVEHIEERYLPNLLSDFERCGLICMTFAEPGQQGYHHVNLQTADYWLGALAAIGFQLDRPLTDMTRLRSAANTNPYNHYRRSGLAFTRA